MKVPLVACLLSCVFLFPFSVLAEGPPAPGEEAGAEPSGGAIVARFLDGADRPVAGVRAEARPRGGQEGETVEPVRGESDAKGALRLANVPAGTWRLVIRPPRGRAMVLDNLEVASGKTLDLGRLVVEEGLVLSGRVVDGAGDPVPGATVRVFRLAGMSTLPLARETAGEDGAFSVAGLDEGTWRVRVSPPRGRNLLPVEEDVEMPGGPLELVLEEGAVLEALVRTDDEEPLEDPAVRVVGLDEEGRVTGRWKMERDEEADLPAHEARFRAAGLPPGRYQLLATARERAPRSSEPVEVAAGETIDDLELVLDRGVTIEGAVVDRESGAPVVGARVRAEPSGEETETGDDGAFSLAGFGAGAARLVAEHPDYAPASVSLVVDPDEPPTDVTIRLGRGGRVVGTVTRWDGRPVPGQVIEVETDAGPGGTATTGPDGTFAIGGLPAGPAVVLRRGFPGDVESVEKRPVAIPEGGEVRVDFRLGTTVEGAVTRAGVPVSGARVVVGHVSVDPAEPWRSGWSAGAAWTGPDGRFVVPSVPPGRATVVVDAGGQRSTRMIDVPEGERVEVAVHLPTRPVRGVVRAAESGEPLPGASVHASPTDGARGTSMQVVTVETGPAGTVSELVAGGGEGEETAAGPDGTFVLAIGTGRPWIVSVSAAGRKPAGRQVPPGDDPVELTFELTRTVGLAIDAVDPAGRPLEQVTACTAYGRMRACGTYGTGVIRLKAEEGPVTVSVGSPGYGIARERFVVSADRVADDGAVHRRFVLSPGGSLEVFLAPGDALAGLQAPDGEDWLPAFAQLDRLALAEEEGSRRAILRDVPVGEWTVLVRRGEETRPFPVTVRAGETATVDAR